MNKIYIFLFIVLFLGTLLPIRLSAEVSLEELIGDKPKKEAIPEITGPDWTEITCDGNMLVNYRENWVRFARNVRVNNQRGKIFSDLLIIFMEENGKRVDRAESRGNVRILMGGREGTGDALIYYPEEKKAVLIGHAALKEGNNTVRGKSITFYTDTRDIEIDGAREVEFHPRTEFQLDF